MVNAKRNILSSVVHRLMNDQAGQGMVQGHGVSKGAGRNRKTVPGPEAPFSTIRTHSLSLYPNPVLGGRSCTNTKIIIII